MKIRELFEQTDISQSIEGTATFLGRDNCRIVNKTKNENSIILHLKRESDGEEGRTHLKVRDEYRQLSHELLSSVFVNKEMIGTTLNEIAELETGLSIEGISGRLRLVGSNDP